MNELQHMSRNRAKIERLFDGEPPITEESVAESFAALTPEQQGMVTRINQRWADGNRAEYERRQKQKNLILYGVHIEEVK